jgi:Acetyltransferases
MLNFQKAKQIDAEAIAQLINSSYRGETSRIGWTTEADILDGLRTTKTEVERIIKSENAFILIGVLDDEVVATMCCERQELGLKKIAHFGMIAVNPKLQNKGYGKTLINAAEATCLREWQVAGFQMAVISMRLELIEFYERRGYIRTGEFTEFPINSDLWRPKVEGLNLLYLAKLA